MIKMIGKSKLGTIAKIINIPVYIMIYLILCFMSVSSPADTWGDNPFIRPTNTEDEADSIVRYEPEPTDIIYGSYKAIDVGTVYAYDIGISSYYTLEEFRTIKKFNFTNLSAKYNDVMIGIGGMIENKLAPGLWEALWNRKYTVEEIVMGFEFLIKIKDDDEVGEYARVIEARRYYEQAQKFLNSTDIKKSTFNILNKVELNKNIYNYDRQGYEYYLPWLCSGCGRVRVVNAKEDTCVLFPVKISEVRDFVKTHGRKFVAKTYFHIVGIEKVANEYEKGEFYPGCLLKVTKIELYNIRGNKVIIGCTIK